MYIYFRYYIYIIHIYILNTSNNIAPRFVSVDFCHLSDINPNFHLFR